MTTFLALAYSRVGRTKRGFVRLLAALLLASVGMGASSAPARAINSYSEIAQGILPAPGAMPVRIWGDLGGLARGESGQWVDVSVSFYIQRPGETGFYKAAEVSYSGADDAYDLTTSVDLPVPGSYLWYTEGVYTLLQNGETTSGPLEAFPPRNMGVRYPSRTITLTPFPASATYRQTGAVVVRPTLSMGTGVTDYWRVSGPCTVARLVVTPTGAGDCVIGASVAEFGIYPAASATLTISIAPTPRTLSLTASASSLLYRPGASASLSATPSAGGGAIAYRLVSGPCNVNGSVVTAAGAGVCVLRASVAAANDYAAAESGDAQIRIDRAQRSLSFAGAPTTATVGASFALAAQPSAGGGALTYSVLSGPCTLRGSILTPNGVGPCTVQARIEADAGFEAASVDLTINAVRPARRLDLVATPSSLTVGGVAQLSATPSAGTGEIRYVLLNGPCSLAGVALRGDAVGSCRVQATIAASGDEIAATSSIVDVAVGKTATVLTLSVANASPIVGAAVTLTATVSPPGATGLVTFRDNGATLAVVPLGGGVAATTTASLAFGGHDITAAYAGDTTYLASASAGLRVTATRPPPTAVPTVTETLNRQTQVVQRATSGANDAIQRRLETLHGDNIPTFSNGVSISNGGANPPTPAGLPGAVQAYAPDDGEAARRLAAFIALDRQTQADRKPESGAAPPIFQPALYTWTAGTIQVAEARNEGLPETTKSRYQSFAIGFDRPFTEDVKLGVTLGLLHGKDVTGHDGSQSRVLVWNAALYQSWRLFDQLFLDTFIGVGAAQFRLQRYDANASGLLRGDRPAHLALGSATLSWEQSYGDLKFAPYGKVDFIRSKLAAYSETGDPNFALDFGRMTTSGVGVTGGLRAQYDIPALGGVASPTLRLEYRRATASNAVQDVSFVSDPGATYAIPVVSAKRDSLTTGVGLKASGGAATGQIEYIASVAPGGGYRSQGLRGTLRLGF